MIPLVVWKDDIQTRLDRAGGDSLRFVEGEALFSRFEVLGDRWFVPSMAAAFVLGGLAGGSRREVETGLMVAQSLLFTAAITGLGQFVLAEDRPYEGGTLRLFRTHGHGVSGHSALSASFVIPLDRQYLSIDEEDGPTTRAAKYIGKSFLYTAPAMVAVSRVRSDRHFVWNVVLGEAIGFAVGQVVWEVHERARTGVAQRTTGGTAAVAPGGVTLSWRW